MKSLSRSDMIVLLVSNTALSIINVVLNNILCRTILKLGLLRNIAYHFILSLAISDFIIGICVHSLLSTHFLAHLFESEIVKELHTAYKVCYVVFGQFSAISLVMIAFDRYLHTKYLDFYNAHMTKEKSLFMILGNICTSIVSGFMFVFGSRHGTIFYVVTVLTILYFIIVAMVLVFYAKIFLAFRNHVATFQFQNRHRADLQLLKGIFAIVVSIMICYLPFISYNFFFYYKAKSTNADEEDRHKSLIYAWLFQIALSESSINSMILLLSNRKMRRHLNSIVCRRQDSV